MTEEQRTPEQLVQESATLRQRAEEQAQAMGTEDWETLSPEAVQQALYELQVHQIELGMQNEEVHRVQEELRRSQNLLGRTERLAQVGSWEWDLTTNTVHWSPELYRQYQVDPGQVPQPPFELVTSAIHPEDLPRFQASAQVALETGTLRPIDYRLVLRDGSIRHVRSEGEVVYDAEGQPIRLFGFAQDITKRQQAEEELQQRKAQLEALRQVGLQITSQLDQEPLLHSIVAQAVDLLAGAVGSLYLYRPERDVLEIGAAIGPDPMPTGDTRRRGEGLAGMVWETGQPLVVNDYSHWAGRTEADETTSFPAIVGVPIRWGQEFMGVLTIRAAAPCTFSPADVELLGLFATQAAIAIQNARLFETVARGKRDWEITFDAITDGIALIDADFRVLRVNRTLARWLGTTPQALIGRPCYEWLHHLDTPPPFCVHRQMMQSKQPQSVEVTLPTREGTFLASVDPLFDEHGNLTASVHIFRDISERKRAEEERERLLVAEREQRRLVEQSQAQLVQTEKLAATGRLAASLAHEINNPLQAIHNSLQILRNFPLEPNEQEEYLQMAAEEVERLMNLVTRILEFARRPGREQTPTDLNETIEKVLTLANKYLQHRRVALHRDLVSDLPLVLATEGELGQVFLNLVLNAVDAMPDGGSLRVSSCQTKDGRLMVSFTDTGYGIPPEHLDRIFEPFFSTKEGGTGLGLSITHNIIQQHGGEITVQSQVSEGTTFTVWLPPYANRDRQVHPTSPR